MKIGFDAKRLYNNFTGLGNYSRTLLSNLNLYCPENDYYLYTPEVRHTPETDSFLNNPAYNTVLPDTRLKTFWRTCSVKKELQRDNIDIFHGLSHEIPLGIQHTGIKTVVTIHDIIYKTYPDMFPAIDRAVYDLKFRYSCKHADKIIAISESTKKDIVRYFGTPEEKIEVIYQAINPVFYQMQPEAAARQTVRSHNIPDRYLLYVGAINSRKNLLNIVKAMQLLPSDQRLPLVVVGKGGKYKNEVLEYAETHRLTGSLIWLDNLGDTLTLQAFYQCAEIFIYPSYYEGFGLPVTEALLSKTPVITSNVSSMPDAGGDAAYYINPADVEELAEKIRLILTSGTKAMEERTNQGYQFACEQFDAQRLTRQTNDLYRSLL